MAEKLHFLWLGREIGQNLVLVIYQEGSTLRALKLKSYETNENSLNLSPRWEGWILSPHPANNWKLYLDGGLKGPNF